MNTWPTLQEWLRLGGLVATEVLVVYAIVKLVTRRIQSAPRRRTLWQMAHMAMLLVTIGELVGVRNLVLRPSLDTTRAEQKIEVSFKEPDPTLFSPPSESGEVPVQQRPPTVPALSWWQQPSDWPGLIWATGLALLLARAGLGLLRILFLRRTTWPVTDLAVRKRAERLRTKLQIRRSIRLLECDRAAGPCTFGTWRPCIVLPRRFGGEFSPEQQEVVLAHELAHIAQLDSAWRGLAEWAVALLWWHPLAWLARRELVHASELAADEASQLIPDGPARLAECLLTCARRARQPALIQWLGMDGDGFQSSLGKRVAHLLALQEVPAPGRPVPWFVRLIAPAGAVVLLWLGAGWAFGPATLSTSPHLGSILGNALAAWAEDQAEASRAAAPLIQVHQKPNQQVETSGRTSLKRQAVQEKLRQIRLPTWGPLNDVPWSEVVRQLSDEIRRLDPSHEGIHFFLSPNAPAESIQTDPARMPGAPLQAGLTNARVNLGTRLADRSIQELLDHMAINGPASYSVEDFGVLITPMPLHTRVFKVDATTFLEQIQSRLRRKTGPATDTIGPTFTHEPPTPEEVIPVVKDWFTSLGVDLTTAAKALFYNDLRDMLMVRATLEDLNVIAKAMAALNMAPLQLNIDVKIMEVPVDKVAGQAWFRTNEWRQAVFPALQGFTNKNTAPLISVLTHEQFPFVIKGLEALGGTELVRPPQLTTLSGRQAQIKVVDVRYVVTDLHMDAKSPPEKPSYSPIAEPFELGPVVDVVPYISANNATVHLTILPSFREFLGYATNLSAQGQREATGLPDLVPKPGFRLRQMVARGEVLDGQTLILRDNIAIQSNNVAKFLLYFVTPRLINSEGNPLRSAEELRELHMRGPPQTGGEELPLRQQGLRDPAKPN